MRLRYRISRFLPVIAIFASTPTAAQEAAHPKVVSATPDTVWLNDTVTVTVEDTAGWLKTTDARDLVLFLQGQPLTNVKAIPLGEGTLQVNFRLLRDDSSKALWSTLLGRPGFETRPVRMQIGLVGRPPFPGSTTLQLRTLDPWWFGWAAGSFLLLFISFIVLAVRSDVLREGSISAPMGKRRPYSLGRFQMAFWFFLVLSSFVFIWIVTGSYDPLTPSVLALIGISAATAASGAVIDSNKLSVIEGRGAALAEERRRLETESKALSVTVDQSNTAIGQAPAGTDVGALRQQVTKAATDLAAKQERLIQVDEELTVVAAAVQPAPSNGFLNDILSDDNGVSFHRFQIAVWTIVLGVVFVYTVHESLAMPDFDPKLLALMAISSGTYLGFKFPETK
jgi:hypothetical protein